jgi:hypothetical protein
MLLPLGGCFDVSAPATPATPAPTAGGYEAETRTVRFLTNSFPASESRAALARAARLDTYAADAARHDGTLRRVST